jgi:NTP pyrophosphatase (non-canonical NTP hydrolase)
MTRPAWSQVPRPKVERFAAIALGEAGELAQAILREIRHDFPHLRLVEGESGEPMALVGIRRAIERFVQPGCRPRCSRSSGGGRA